MVNLTRMEEINSVCIGYSGQHHWQFFREALSHPDIKNICMIGVYYGRDIAYMKAIAEELGRTDCMIVGVDKFEDRFCDDWPEEKRNLTWEEAGFGQAPDLQKTRSNLLKLGLSGNVFLVSDFDVNFLQNTAQMFDLIYIDTSHDYQSVKNLINLALRKVKPHGFLAGDDFSDEGTWGVAKAVRESFPKFELFYNWIWLARVSELGLQNNNLSNQIKSNQIKSNQITHELESNRKVMTKGNSLLCKLVSAYEEEGYTISVGLNPLREKSANGGFNYLLKHDLVKKIYQPTRLPFFSTGGGVAVDEINLLKDILQQFNPEIEYFIGIAAGWSTNALGLINPKAKLYGIDNCSEGTEGKQALELAVKIANKLNINFHAYVGASPQDVPQSLSQVIKQGKTIDFALIDGLHTNEQVYLDFQAILPYLSDSAIVAFHDVLNFNMLEGWGKIIILASRSGFKNKILRRTTSGMAILYRNISAEIEATILSYYQHPFILCPT